jgi:hypothetical protein
MHKSKVHFVFLVLLGAILSLQIHLVSAQESQKPHKVTVNKDGWLVPGRDDFKKESKVIEKNIDGVEVTHRIMESPAEIFVDVSGKTVELFAKRKSDALILSVRGFSVYEANGRVFAYGITLVPVDVTKRGKLYYKSYIGAMYSLFYLDENGDGIFESRYVGLPLPSLPDWARQNV